MNKSGHEKFRTHKKGILFICLFVFMVSKSYSDSIISKIDQDKKIEQLQLLKASLNKIKLGEEDLQNLIRIQNLYESLDIDSALVYVEKEVNVASQTGNQDLLAGAKIRKAKLLRKLRCYKEAREVLLTNLDESSTINDSLKGKTWSILASINARSGQFTKATNNSLEAISLFLCQNDSINLLSSYRFIARIYYGLGDKEKATEYHQIASQYDNQFNKRLSIKLLIDKSITLRSEGNFEASLREIQKAQTMTDSLIFPELRINLQVQYARLYYEWKNFEKLIQHALKADSLLDAHPITLVGMKNNLYKYLAQGYLAQQNYSQAEHYLILIDTSDIYQSIEVKSQLIKLYEELRNYELAHLTNKALYAIQDSLNHLQQKVQIKEILEKYENNKKQFQIEELEYQTALQEVKLNSQVTTFYASVGFLFLLLISSIIFYKSKISKQRLKEVSLNLEKITLQHQFLRTQLNPHFLFHALTSIEAYILKGEKEKAANFLQDFSRLMRNILETSNIDFIPLKEDLSFIKKYSELQQLNHEFKFNYTINIDENIDSESILIPSMITQPFVENAIIHGALPSNGFVEITVNKTLEYLIIQILNTSINPPKTPNESKKLHRSMSTDIVKQRIDNLRKSHGLKIIYTKSTHFVDTSDKISITLTFPLLYKSSILRTGYIQSAYN